MEYGIDDEYFNYSFNTSDKLGISDITSDRIREKTKELINETYRNTENKLKEYEKSIESVAKLLMRKGIITKKEAINAFNRAKKDDKVQEEKEVEEAN